MVPESLHNSIDDALCGKERSCLSTLSSERSWFPDAFGYTMNQLLIALEQEAAPALNGKDHLRTLAVVEAAIKSSELGRVVSPIEVLEKK